MVCARASLASWSQLWSLQLSQHPSCGLLVSEVAAVSPSLCLSFPMVSGRMVLQEVEVSQIYQCSFVPVFSSVVQFDVGWSAFQVRKINSLLMSTLCFGKWSRKKSEYFNPLEMLCCLITVRPFLHSKSWSSYGLGGSLNSYH